MALATSLTQANLVVGDYFIKDGARLDVAEVINGPAGRYRWIGMAGRTFPKPVNIWLSSSSWLLPQVIDPVWKVGFIVGSAFTCPYINVDQIVIQFSSNVSTLKLSDFVLSSIAGRKYTNVISSTVSLSGISIDNATNRVTLNLSGEMTDPATYFISCPSVNWNDPTVIRVCPGDIGGDGVVNVDDRITSGEFSDPRPIFDLDGDITPGGGLDESATVYWAGNSLSPEPIDPPTISFFGGPLPATAAVGSFLSVKILSIYGGASYFTVTNAAPGLAAVTRINTTGGRELWFQGTLTTAGTYNMTLSLTNASGVANSNHSLVVTP